ncbi:DUF2793 domain-containing protein [Neorhizobium sp. NPDC001467]|uniref:DUF2793 domain-containing protein n=1 Tax=Neorhizobium sp. NPDC001467 TaxID=3390595 RepID=UPI003D050A62
MTDRTPHLSMPFILPSQAQKHVTHNEALLALDAIVQLAIDGETAVPPDMPAEGARLSVAAGAGGLWTGRDGQIATWQDGAWSFLRPREGWLAWFAATHTLKIYRGTAWSDLHPDATRVSSFGINTDADANNRLAVASDASLFSHVGHGHQAKINKAAATDTASLLFQSGWAGHAEMGLAGDNDFSIKVSNGTDWLTALKIRQNGTVVVPQRPTGRAYRTDGTVTPASGSDSGFTSLDQVQGGIKLGATVGDSGRTLKVPETGLYLLSILMLTISSSGHATSLIVNGSQTLFTIWSPTAAPASLSHTEVVALNAGDELSFRYLGMAQIHNAPGSTQLTVALL